MDFGTLKSRIEAIIGRAPAAVCYELVTADINRDMRLKVMESTTTLTEAASISLPSDFLQIVDIYRDSDPRVALRPVPAQVINRVYETSGTPSRYAIIDGSILLDRPGSSESLAVRYYAKLTDLSADSDENDVLTTYPAIYVYGALAHHAALIRDTNAAAIYEAKYKEAKRLASKDDVQQRMGNGPIIPVVGTAP